MASLDQAVAEQWIDRWDAQQQSYMPDREERFAAMIDARATLHDAIVSAGMSVLGAMLEEERAKLCGPRYAHQPGRTATRSGHTDGELALGGRRMRVRRPRVRGIDGDQVSLETWDQFAAAGG